MLLSVPYIIKSTVILATLLIYFLLFLRKDTFFQLHRVYLLSGLSAAVIVPFIQITIPVYDSSPDTNIHYIANLLEEVNIRGQQPDVVSVKETMLSGISWLYISGIVFFGVKYLFALVRLFGLIRNNPKRRIQKIHFVRLSQSYPVFSFFNYIFINDRELSKENRQKIIEHEKIHIRQWHSLDLLVCEIICILNWFNPLVWIFQHFIAQNHEYIADKQVIRKYQTGSYLQLLINQAFKGSFSFTNCFSCSNLKKRMIMMTKQQTKRYKLINYLPAILLSSILIIGFTCKANIEIPEQSMEAADSPVGDFAVADTTNEETIFNVVEVMPKFPGNMLQWIGEHTKYPTKAQEQNKQGKVYVNFVVTKEGKIRNPKVAKSVDSLLDAEALRVVKSMPDWTPGKQRGQAVNVSYTLPINFSLGSKGNTAAKPEISEDNTIFQFVENMPKFSEGNPAEWIRKNTKYPAQAVTAKQEGKVYVQFVIEKNGAITDIGVSQGTPYPLLNQEAVRVIQSMPTWIPGKQRGKAVRVKYTLPINFKL